MKLGLNHKTGENWSLVSSISGSAPGPLKKMKKNREKVHWKTGELMKNNRFELLKLRD